MSNRILTIIVAITLGVFGIHQFCLDKTKKGLLILGLTFITGIGGFIITIMDIVKFCKMSNSEFDYNYNIRNLDMKLKTALICLVILFAIPLCTSIYKVSNMTEAEKKELDERIRISDAEEKCDDAIIAFELYLKDNMRDPDSFEVIEKSCVYNDYRKCYVADVKFRAKNGFGGYSIERVVGDIILDKNGYSYFKNVTLLNRE